MNLAFTVVLALFFAIVPAQAQIALHNKPKTLSSKAYCDGGDFKYSPNEIVIKLTQGALDNAKSKVVNLSANSFRLGNQELKSYLENNYALENIKVKSLDFNSSPANSSLARVNKIQRIKHKKGFDRTYSVKLLDNKNLDAQQLAFACDQLISLVDDLNQSTEIEYAE